MLLSMDTVPVMVTKHSRLELCKLVTAEHSDARGDHVLTSDLKYANRDQVDNKDTALVPCHPDDPTLRR